MERFVRAIVAGGVALVAGLWVVDLLPAWSAAWGVGVALALAGVAALGYGLRLELVY